MTLEETWKEKRVRTPTVIQMEALECGAAALGIVLGYYGRIVPLEELRLACGVSRDGSKAGNVAKAARNYGLEAQVLKKDIPELQELKLPVILFWNFNHFLVLEGIRKGKIYLNDPASGPRVVSAQEFDESFTGVVIALNTTSEFKPGGVKDNLRAAFMQRIAGCRMALLFVVLAGLFLVLPGLIVPTFTKIFVDNILVRQMNDWLKPLLVGMLLTAVINLILTWLQQFCLLRLETKMAVVSASKFFQHVFRLPISFFAQRYAGDIANRIMLNDQIANVFSSKLATTLVSLPMIPFYAVLMFAYDGLLTSISISIALLNLLALRYVARRRVDLNQRLQQEQGRLMGVTMSGVSLIESLKAGGLENDFYAQWSGTHAKVINAKQQNGFFDQILSALPPFLVAINGVIILVLGSLRVMSGDLSAGSLVAFQGLMASFLMPVNQLVDLGGTLQTTIADVKRIDDVFNYPPRPVTPEQERLPAAAEPAKLEGYLTLTDVTFGYSRLEPPYITEFNLQLRPGSRVALVGGSGSGKSTVARLVSGLYAPWSGEVLFDGKPLSSWPRRVFSSSVACVDQDISLFAGNIRENITLWDASIPEADIIQAAKDACIHDDIMERSGGYDATVEEGGRNFSGGQRQRLEIARALVVNPRILVLDEATSALDPATEKAVDDNLRRRGCTCLIIAHRLSTIRDCDEIIVLAGGRPVQRGTHSKLVNEEGLYQELIKKY